MENLTYGKAVAITVLTGGEPVMSAQVPLGMPSLVYSIVDAAARGIPKSYHDQSELVIACGVTEFIRERFDLFELNDFGYVQFVVGWNAFKEKMK